MKRGKRIRREHVITYLAIFMIVGLGIGLLYFVQNGMTGFAVYTSGPGSGQTTLTLQDADTDNLGDSYVDGGLANRNKGIDSDLKIQRNPYQRIYIKFDISQVPLNQIIDNSQLCLYLYNDQSSQTVSVSHVYIHNWNEGSEDNVDVSGQDYTTNISWNNQPCGTDFDNSANCNLTAESFISDDGTLDGTWQCWNVTNAVSSEYVSGDKNVSLILYTEDLGNPDIFYSKEYTADTTLIPLLNITYHSANLAPLITIIEPQNQLYTSNESLDLNFSVLDEDGNLDSCWYTLNSGITNITLANCQNTTFNISEGIHILEIYANDTDNLEASDNVSFSVDPNGVSVLITEPSGTKNSRINLPIEYTTIGNNLTCWYNVKTSILGSVIENTTLDNCTNSTFNVANDGDYILNIYVNNSFGTFDSDSTSFTVSTSSSDTVVVSGGGGGSSTTIITTNGTTKLSVGSIQNLIVEPKAVKRISLSTKNTGTAFLNDCKVKGEGGYSSWISSEELKDLSAGEEYDFSFELNVPEVIEAGKYILTLSLTCQEISELSSFTAEIIEKMLILDIINVEGELEDEIKITYSLESFFDIEQVVELEFLLFDSNNEEIAEVNDVRLISANSKQEFDVLIPIDSSLQGDLSLLVNLNSETYSTFIQEDIVLGSLITGLVFFEDFGGSDSIITGILILAFIGFSVFIIIRIYKHKKKIKKKRKGKKKKSLI